MANFYSELAPNIIFNKDPTALLRLHERPQATDNSMQLLNLHQTNGNGNQTTQFYVQYTTKNPISYVHYGFHSFPVVD